MAEPLMLHGAAVFIPGYHAAVKMIHPIKSRIDQDLRGARGSIAYPADQEDIFILHIGNCIQAISNDLYGNQPGARYMTQLTRKFLGCTHINHRRRGFGTQHLFRLGVVDRDIFRFAEFIG